ncbi:MAG: hypothetical protein ACYTHM_20990 [Planctomycetota bacterium]|jgi:hypothetical protein
MAMKQQALIVEYSPSWFGEEDKTRVIGGMENWKLSDGKGIEEINRYLEEGWRVAVSSAMGATGGGEAKVLFRSYASLIVLEKGV